MDSSNKRKAAKAIGGSPFPYFLQKERIKNYERFYQSFHRNANQSS